MILLERPAAFTMVGTVIEVHLGWCLVRTDGYRSVKAETAMIWRVGDRVTVVEGQITGRAGGRPPSKVYEV